MSAPRLLFVRPALLSWVIMLIFAAPPHASACMICVPYPQQTLADRLQGKDEIIFAREVADAPYQFYPVEILDGLPPDGPFRIFCNSSTRRKLRVIPDSAVVLTRDGNREDWELITFADAEYRSFIRQIVGELDRWGERRNSRKRIAFFTPFLTYEHDLIQEQAFLEVGRAPYAMIRRVAPLVPTQKIYTFLGNHQYIEWHNLYILLLGQSRDPDDHHYIRTKVEALARSHATINLAAWLTAFIESHPHDGIDQVEAWYFTTRGRTKEELEELLASLTVLGSQQPDFARHITPLRTEIVHSFSTLLENYPEMAGNVARILTMWQISAHTGQLSDILADQTLLAPPASAEVSYYLSRAVHFSRVPLSR